MLINRLAIGAVQISVFNFSQREASTTISSAELPIGAGVVDLGTSEEVAVVRPRGRHSDDDQGAFDVTLAPLAFQALILKD